MNAFATAHLPRSTEAGIRKVTRGIARRLVLSTSGLAATEFALMLPVLMSMGMYGAEIAYMTSVNMQVNQLAVSVADNASRLGQTDNSATTPTVTESDVDSVMQGALHQGENIDFNERGRIILSSFERDSATNRQFIHWRRCSGELVEESEYGNATNRNGLTGAEIEAIGKPGKEVTVDVGLAVMFVEVYYRHEGIFGSMFIDDDVELKQEAAFLVRDDRNLMPTNQQGVTGTGGESHCT
ncbi:MAG: pilus assembly protein TadE [Novosphingobium sp.]